MFLSRWRWNLNRSLLVLRWKGGRKNPPPIQRMEADDMMAALFPLAAACQENVSGPVELPDHVIVQQTMHDTLREAMDVDGLRTLVERLEADEIEVVAVDTTEPSPLCHELLVGKAFTFLDDAEAIDRRSRAVPLRRGLPVDLTEIGAVSTDAIAAVAEQVIPDPRTTDELFELLASLVVTKAVPAWRDMYEELADAGRAIVGVGTAEFWAVRSSRTLAAALRPDLWPEVPTGPKDRTDALTAAVRGRLDLCATTTVSALASQLGIDESSVEFTLVGLESEGFALQGNWGQSREASSGTRAEGSAKRWASRRLLARMHVYSQKGKRAKVEPATAQDFMRFLFEWQHLAPGSQLSGVDGLTSVVAQLQGWHVAAAAWEPHVLRDRLTDFRPELLDRRSLAGDITWGRLAIRDTDSARPTATKATPITLLLRNDLDWLVEAVRGQAEPTVAEEGCARELLDELHQRGARFHHELGHDTKRPAPDIEQGLWELVWRGNVHADSFHAVRSLFDARDRRSTPARARRGLRKGTAMRLGGEGRWTVFAEHRPDLDRNELAEAVAEQLLARWGVVFHALVEREDLALPWRELLWALRRLEARGLVLGGRFVSGFSGEQYATAEAAAQLDRIRRTDRSGVRVEVNACDPANLTGIITPGERTSARRSQTVVYVDGLPQRSPQFSS